MTAELLIMASRGRAQAAHLKSSERPTEKHFILLTAKGSAMFLV